MRLTPLQDPELFAKMLCNIDLHVGQLELLRCQARDITACCGRRWGKTTAQAVGTIMFALRYPGSTQFCVAPTQDQAGVIFQEMHTLLMSGPLEAYVGNIRYSPFPAIELRNGSKINARSAGTDGKYLRGHHADRIIVDECFPAGTLVDGRPIESYRPGDSITAWDPERGLVQSSVLRIGKRKPMEIVSIQTSDGTISCTGEHPFLTPDGWRKARDLRDGDRVAMRDLRWRGGGYASSSVSGTSGREPLLFGAMPEGQLSEPSLSHGRENGSSVLQVRSSGDDLRRKAFVLPRVGQCLLLKGVRAISQAGALARWTRSLPSRAPRRGERVRATCDDSLQSTRVAGQDARNAQAHWSQAASSRRQGGWVDDTAADARQSVGLADGIDCRHGQEDSALLRDRHSQSDREDRSRNRRRLALIAGEEGVRPAEGSVSRWARVDRVALQEPGRDGTFGGLCSDGFVYNLEVAEQHTYLAQDFIVHNCAFVPAQVMDEVIPPMLAMSDYQYIVKISTPYGRNHFFDSYENGKLHQDLDFASFRFPTWTNPFIVERGDGRFLIRERQRRTKLAWDVEYGALFNEDQNAMFPWRHIEACTNNELRLPVDPVPDHSYVIGYDPAKWHDRSALVVLDVTERPWQVVALQDLAGREYSIQEEMVSVYAERYYNAPVHQDATSTGSDRTVEALQMLGVEVYPFRFTNDSKYELMSSTALALEKREIELPGASEHGEHRDLLKELQYYQLTVSKSNRPVMGAPEKEGFYDDYATALALSHSLASYRLLHNPEASVSFY